MSLRALANNESRPRSADLRRGLALSRLLGVIAVTVYLLTSPAPVAANSATQVVDNLHAALLDVMKQANELGYPGRYQRLGPVISVSYDFPFIAKVVVGRHWQDFSDVQKSKFVEMFSKLGVATYAARFDGYSGERFEALSEEIVRGNRILVKSVLIKSNGDRVTLDYLLHENDNHWRIINVIADGVSDLSLKRADYTAFLRKNSFNDLLNKLNEKIAHYAE